MFLQIDKTYPVILLCVIAILGNSYYHLNKDYQEVQQDLAVANSTITTMNAQSIKINKELEANSRKIQGLINDNIKVNENLNDAIKKSECANTSIPVDAVNILRSKANSSNQDADTSQSNTGRNNTAIK